MKVYISDKQSSVQQIGVIQGSRNLWLLLKIIVCAHFSLESVICLPGFARCCQNFELKRSDVRLTPSVRMRHLLLASHMYLCNHMKISYRTIIIDIINIDLSSVSLHNYCRFAMASLWMPQFLPKVLLNRRLQINMCAGYIAMQSRSSIHYTWEFMRVDEWLRASNQYQQH